MCVCVCVCACVSVCVHVCVAGGGYEVMGLKENNGIVGIVSSQFEPIKRSEELLVQSFCVIFPTIFLQITIHFLIL